VDRARKPNPVGPADPHDGEARLPILLVESAPKASTESSISHDLAVLADAVDGERHAREGANPQTASASITDDGIGGATNDVADCSGIGRTSVERNGSWPTSEAGDA